MLSGWNRGAAVNDSEFSWLGDAAVISAGLSGNKHDNTSPEDPYGEGLVLSGNLAHELGIFIKQTGFYYHAMTANATVVGNVFFNGEYTVDSRMKSCDTVLHAYHGTSNGA